jgi:hypothetical protein
MSLCDRRNHDRQQRYVVSESAPKRFRAVHPIRGGTVRPTRTGLCVEETTDWVGHSPGYLSRFREGLEKLRRTGTAVLYD